MIEFAAGMMLGGSIGAVIMGALLAQTRTLTSDRRLTAAVQARAAMQAPRHLASRSATASARHDVAETLTVFSHPTLASAAQLH